MVKKYLLYPFVILLAIYFSSSFSFAYSGMIMPAVNEYITSKVANTPSPLRFQCKTEDYDLGMHELRKGKEFSWKFPSNMISPLCVCHFYWREKQAVFDVWSSKIFAKYNASDMYYDDWLRLSWEVRPDGFYGYNHKKWEKVAAWK